MKVFIYHQLIQNSAIRGHCQDIARVHKLRQQLEYLDEFYEYFKRYETTDPLEADFFFVPFFLTGWQFLNHDPKDFIEQFCPHINRGKHIFVATGDFGQRKLSAYEMQTNPKRAYAEKFSWLDDRFILLALESTAELAPQDIGFPPYPTRTIERLNVDRDIFLSFMGATTYEWLEPDHIRGQRLQNFIARNTNPSIVMGRPQEVTQRLGCAVSFDELMARSVFTLAPAGYGRWSFRSIEAILHGSIPVILSDGYVFPFADRIKWTDYCIVVPEKDFDSLEQILGAIPAAEIHRLQANMRRDRALFERPFVQQAVADILEERAEVNPKEAPADAAVRVMRAPPEMGIICVDVTNKCDRACSNCTRLLANQDKLWEMSPENFRLALRSLEGYGGMIAMIGGNPCMHSKFAEMCKVFAEEVPDQRRRGLWTNNIFKHREVIEATFGGFNLNPHNNPSALPDLRALYQTMVVERHFSGGLYEGSSDHSPLLTAVKDLYSEREMWNKITRCDINRDWSASIVQHNGELRVYFCEVAASFDLARNEDHGFPLTVGWWRDTIERYADQIKHFCPGCGVPARLKGNLDYEEVDTYTESNKDIALKAVAKKKRKVIFLEDCGPGELGHKVTKYAENAR